jgi:O-antigen ligase
MWLYTVLRFGLFLALWGLLVLAGLGGLLAGVLAVVLSVPLAYFLLARPRARLAATVEQRIEAQRAERSALDKQLSGDEDPEV